MSLGLQEGAGVTPQAQPPISAAPGHTHLPPSHTQVTYPPTFTYLSALALAHLGLLHSQSSEICCVHAMHLFRTCALTAPLCPSKEECVHTHSLVHSCSHFLVYFCLLSVPLTKCLCSCVFFSTALPLAFLLSFNKGIVLT